MNIADAEPQDYINHQGGMPKVVVDETTYMTIVHHDYPDGKGMVVRSHKSIDDYGEIMLETPQGIKRFKVAFLRAFHGEPCESSSRQSGGKGQYDRRGQFSK